MTPPPLLTQEEHRLLDALAVMVHLDQAEANKLLWFTPLKNRAWGAARAICGYTKLPLDTFSLAVASSKLGSAFQTVRKLKELNGY